MQKQHLSQVSFHQKYNTTSLWCLCFQTQNMTSTNGTNNQNNFYKPICKSYIQIHWNYTINKYQQLDIQQIDSAKKTSILYVVNYTLYNISALIIKLIFIVKYSLMS